ncbi:MAG: hypothetical protein P8Y66_03155 [Nitrospirota bacterium]|jgi:hypothetical protein
MINNSISAVGNHIDIATALYSLLSLILGGVAGATVSIFYSTHRARNESKSLMTAISYELILAFERCVLYYEQAKKGKISYSALFAFTDANIFSRFVSVHSDARVAAAIINLKADYFQISRHVDEASRLAAGMGVHATKSEEESERMQAALKAQSRAMAFFLSSYDRIMENTDILLGTTQKMVPSAVADDLAERFRKGQEKVDKLMSSPKKAGR